MSEIITNKQVENNIDEQMKPILTDMLKYSPSKIVGFLGNLIVHGSCCTLLPVHNFLRLDRSLGTKIFQSTPDKRKYSEIPDNASCLADYKSIRIIFNCIFFQR